MNRKILIIAGLFVASLLVALVLRSRQQQREQVILPTPTPVRVPAPTFPPQRLDRAISYRFTGPSPTPAPTHLPLYTNRSPISVLAIAQDLAQHFELTGTPKQSTGSRGTFYHWTQEATGKSLSVGGDPIEVAYVSGSQPSQFTTLTRDELDTRARTFISSLAPVGNSVELAFLPPVYIAPEQGEPRRVAALAQATVAQLNYRYQIDNIPLFTRYPSIPSVSVQLNGAGEIVQLTGYWFPGLQKQTNIVSLVSWEHAVQLLTSGQGSLLFAQSAEETNSETLPGYKFSASNIQSTELGYYYTPGTGELSPIYLFHGIGRDTTTGAEIKTTSAVSALSQ